MDTFSGLKRSFVMLLVMIFSLSLMIIPASAADVEIPRGATIDSATFIIYGRVTTGQIVNVHRITAPWTETGVTWNNFGGSYDPAVVGSFIADSVGWHEVDVTALVQAWVDGTYDNYGILLEQGETEFTPYWSSEFINDVTLRPMLEICYTFDVSSSCVTIQRLGADQGGVMDAYIWELKPDLNRGSSTILYTGLVSGYEKQSLLRFDFDVVSQGEGCTPGGWAGGNGEFRWNVDNDPDWDPAFGNPFSHGTSFNDFFTPWGSFDGLTMIDLVSKGGGKDDARKAARSLVAAYLNVSHANVDYPLTTTELETLWADAVAGNSEFIDLHINLDELNNLGCEP